MEFHCHMNSEAPLRKKFYFFCLIFIIYFLYSPFMSSLDEIKFEIVLEKKCLDKENLFCLILILQCFLIFLDLVLLWPN